MKIIKTQEELDNLKEVKADEEVIIESELKLNSILKVNGKLIIKNKLDCDYYNLKYIEAYGNANVKAWGNANVEAYGNANVKAYGNANVEAWDNANVEAWGNAMVRAFSNTLKIILNGFSILTFDNKLKIKFTKKSKQAIVHKTKLLPYLEREGIDIKNKKVILYKRVSKEFKTQEDTPNKTLWTIGSVVEHSNWNPKENECREGKFHACSRPFFCDEFRNNSGDKYIAVEVAVKDLFEWKNNPQYLHKIAFRKCKVLHECDKNGKEIKK